MTAPRSPRPGTVDLCYQDDPLLLPAAEAMRRIVAHVPVLTGSETLELAEENGIAVESGCRYWNRDLQTAAYVLPTDTRERIR